MVEVSRFQRWPSIACWVLLAAVAGLICLGAVQDPSPVVDSSTVDVSPDRTDNGLYQAILIRMHEGDSYYQAVNVEHAERGYPTRPVMTVREPAMSYAITAVGGVDKARILLMMLGIAVAICLLVSTEKLTPNRLVWWVSVLLFSSALAAAYSPKMVVIHEIWAALLMVLSLVASNARRPTLSAALGLFAVLVRELAFPFLVVMLALAWRERRMREVKAYAISMIMFLLAYGMHVAMVLTQTSSGVVKSPGWLVLGGWAFVLETVRSSSALLMLPVGVTAVVVPLAIVGWLSRTGPFADRVLLLLALYFPTFMIIGQPWNAYWGLLYTTLLLPGLAWAPVAVRELARRPEQPKTADAYT